MKWWQYLIKIRKTKNTNPEWREGQVYFNVLEVYLPELAAQVRGTDLDPFYNDDRLDAFREWVSLRLE